MNILTRLRKPVYFVLIASLLLQNSLFLSAFKPEKAKAVTPVSITQINFRTAEQILDKNQISEDIRFRTEDQFGNKLDVSEDTTFILNTTSTTGKFYKSDDESFSCDNNCAITMKKDDFNKHFHYSDATYGTYTLTVTAPDHTDWTAATQNITIADAVAPESSIDNPTSDSHLNALSEITGTATDNRGISKVQIKLRDYTDSKYFNGSSWVDEENTWIDASLYQTVSTDFSTSGTGVTANWEYQISNGVLTSGHMYKIYSKAFDTNEPPLEEKNANDYKVYFYFDNEAPTGSIIINNGADATNGDDWYADASISQNDGPQIKLDFTYIDEGSVADSTEISSQGKFESYAMMRVSNNADLSDDGINENSGDWMPFVETIAPWNISSTDGLKHVYVQFKDLAGNLSPIYTDDIFYSIKNNGENKIVLSEGENEIDLFDEQVEFTINTQTGKTTDFFYSSYESNPIGSDSGIKFLDHYYDFNVADDNAIAFPVNVKIYFTQDDLDKAGLTIDQIQGLYFWNFATSGWEFYPGSEVVLENEGGFIGYVQVDIMHFTPMSIGGDITAPSKVLNLKAEPKDAAVKLTWDKLGDAAKYEIQYRQSTSDDAAIAYSSIISTTNNETEIAGLTNGVQYEFNVRAVDSAGNHGEWAVVVATPKASGTTADQGNNSNGWYGWYGYYGADTAYAADTTTTSTTATSDNKPKGPEIVTQGEQVKGEETTEGETEGARTAVTIGIIIIAIGAALGGYYGYQWWIAGSHEEEDKKDKPKTVDNKPKPKKVNRRW